MSRSKWEDMVSALTGGSSAPATPQAKAQTGSALLGTGQAQSAAQELKNRKAKIDQALKDAGAD